MKILPKYLIFFFISTSFTMGVAGVSLWGVNGLSGTSDQLFERDMVINSHLSKFTVELSRLRQVEKEFFAFADTPSRQGKYIIVWNNLYSAILEDIIPVLEGQLREKNATRELAMVARIRELMEENSLEWQRVTKKFSETGSFDAVNMSEYGIFKKRMNELEDIAAQMTENSVTDLEDIRETLQATMSRIELLIKIMLTLSILWGVGGAYVIARRMSGVITEITVMAEQLSCGRVTDDLKVERSDELGDLATALSRIQKSMRILLARLKQAE